MKYSEIAEHYRCGGTPSYVFDIDMLRANIQDIKEVLAGVRLCYAMKANPFIISRIEDLVDYYEVCSPGEQKICREAGIEPESIVLSGVNKELDDIRLAMDDGVCVYTIESELQYEKISQAARDKRVEVNALIRVTSGNQFGVSEEILYRLADKIKTDKYVSCVGIQLYSGTQKKKSDVFTIELQQLDNIYMKLRDEYNIEIRKIEYGPGLFVSYFDNEKKVEADIYALKSAMENMQYDGEIVLEMGRYMTACCGYYITSIVDIKENNNNKYCIVDGGINHLNYYGQAMAMKKMHYSHYRDNIKIEESENEAYTICGSLCTVADVILKNMHLNGPQLDDIIVFENVGAYSVTEGIYLFLSRDMPTIYFYSEDEGLSLIRDRFATYKLNY